MKLDKLGLESAATSTSGQRAIIAVKRLASEKMNFFISRFEYFTAS